MYVHVKNRGLLLRLSDKSNNTLRPILNNVLSIKLKKNNDIQTGVEKHILKNCKENSITSMPSDLLNVTLSYLNYKDWFKLIFVNKKMMISINSNEPLWKTRFMIYFPWKRRCFTLSNFEEAIAFEESKSIAQQCWQKLYDSQAYSPWIREIKYSLNRPATAKNIIDFEKKVNFFLPLQFLTSITIHDGQYNKNVRVLDNLSLLSLDEIFVHYKRLLKKNKTAYKYKLPVAAGSSLGDQNFLYLDLQTNHGIHLQSPHATTDHEIFANWFSFIASIGE